MIDVQRLRDTMKARKMSQQDLADASGLHKVRISQYRHSKSEPRPAALKRLAEALDVPTEYLTGGLEIEAGTDAGEATAAIPNVLNARQAADALGINGQAERKGLVYYRRDEPIKPITGEKEE